MKNRINSGELRAQGKEFQDAAKRCFELADFFDGMVDSANGDAEQSHLFPPTPQRRGRPPNTHSAKLSAVTDFILHHGPAIRKEIQQNTKIKSGTLTAILRKTEIFGKDDQDRFYLKNGSDPAAIIR